MKPINAKKFFILAILVLTGMFFAGRSLPAQEVEEDPVEGHTPPPRQIPDDIKTGTDTPQPPEAASQPEIKHKITTPTLELTEEKDIRKPPIKGAPTISGIKEVPFAPTVIKTRSKTELILDASGSMNGLISESTKLAMLKSAVRDVVEIPPPEGVERDIGLRLYGSQKPSSDADCSDTQLLIPIGPIKKDEFKSRVENMTALGVTPIGNALEAAAADFRISPDFDNVIVLVSDGADSCGANICEIATKLHSGPKKIIIHVVGFDLDQKSAKALKCVSQNGDGQFIQTRSEGELAAAIDQVLMANVPYNLRIRVVSGATPIPASLTVYQSGTKNVVREDTTSGTKFYQLQPGTYDIEVTYTDSREEPKPTKKIERVEVLSTSKAERTLQFDLGMLTLVSFDQQGNPMSATYILSKQGGAKVGAKFDTPPGPVTTWLTDGTYDVHVGAVTGDGLQFSADVSGLKISKDSATTHEFRFEAGKIRLSGVNFEGAGVPIGYRVTPAGDTQKTVLEGTLPKEGDTINLPPGKYDLYASLKVENLKNLPAVKVKNIELGGGDMVEKSLEIPSTVLKLIGKNSEGQPVTTEFSISVAGAKEDILQIPPSKEESALTLPPGNYDIKAELVDSETTPPPVITWDNVTLVKNVPMVKEAFFKFGVLKLIGKNAKGAPIGTSFYVFKAGQEEPVATLIGITEWNDLKLTEGFYDIKAEDFNARTEPKPNVWFHNVEVDAEQPNAKEAVFTHGKLKMLCRGPNNVTLYCDYRVFTYGMDSPLFAGVTEESWKEYDIPPGSYYIEAGYHDAKDEVLLKKWISVRIAENEILEQMIRF